MRTRSFSVLASALALLSCEPGKSTGPTPCQAVLVDRSTIDLVPGQASRLAAGARRADGSALDRQVTWSSSRPEIANVDATGTVTAVVAGTASIVASCGEASATVAVLVNEGGMIGSTGGVISSFGDSLLLTFPPNAAPPGTAVRIERVTEPVPHQRLIAGSAFSFSPDGIAFTAPVTVRFKYREAAIPGGLTASTLRLHKLKAQGWIEEPGSSVDAATGQVIGTLSGFSTYALLASAVDVSPIKSNLTVSSTSVVSGSTLTVTFRAFDDAGLPITTGGAVVEFILSGGTSTGSITAARDNGDGTYTSTFSAERAGTATTLSANVNGVGSAGTREITVVAGPVSAATSLVRVEPGTVAPGQGASLQLIARDGAGNQLTTGGHTVVFSIAVGDGLSTGSIGPTVDRGDGTYTAVFTGASSGLAARIGATVSGVPITSALPSVTVQIPIASVALTPNAFTVVAGGIATLTATVRDATGNLLPGRTCGWQSSAPAIATVSSTGVVGGVTAGQVVITATCDNVAGTSTGTVVAEADLSSLTLVGLGTGGSGTVTSAPAGLNCSFVDGAVAGTCTALFAAGTVTLTAVPATGHAVHGWWNGPSVTVNASGVTGSAAFPINLPGCLVASGFTGQGTETCALTLSSARSVGVSWLAQAVPTLFEEFGDFIDAEPAWTPYLPDGGTTLYEVSGGALRVRRTGAGGAGRGALLSVAVERPVSATTELALDVKPVSASLTAGGATSYEYPANVVVTVRNGDGSRSSIYYAFTISGGSARANTASEKYVVTPVPAGVWSVDQRFVLRAVAPGAVAVERIEVGGIGWDYEAWFDNVRLQEPLSISMAGTGTGQVSLDPGANAGNCFNPSAAACIATYTSPVQRVVLTATPTGGSTFESWSGDCTGTGTCEVTMSQARTVVATFGPSSTNVLRLPLDGVLVDASDLGHVVTGSNVTFTENRHGEAAKAANFNGSSSVLAVADHPSLRFSTTSAFSMTAWVRMKTFGRAQVILGKYSDTFGSFIYLLSTSGVDEKLYFALAKQLVAPNSALASNTSLQANRWYHVAVTYAGGVQRMYIDGVLDGERTYDGGTPSAGDASMPFRLGNQRPDDTYWLDGALDDVRVYSRSLTAGEIAAQHLAEKPAPATYSLSIVGLGSGGSGRVTSSPAGIDCSFTNGVPSGTCIASLPDGSITLQADLGTIQGWWNAPAITGASGSLSGNTQFESNLAGCFTAIGPTTTCTLVLTAERTVGVGFYAARLSQLNEGFDDNDFVATPAWTPVFPDAGTTTFSITSGELRVTRAGAGGAGRGALLEVLMDRAVTGTTEIALDVKAISASLSAGGVTHYEYPANVVVTVQNADNSQTRLYYGFTISGGTTAENTATAAYEVTPVPAGQWAREQRFVIRALAPNAVKVVGVGVGGIGWDYDAWYDNIRVQEPLAITMTGSGNGIIALDPGGNGGTCFNPSTKSCIATYSSTTQSVSLTATPTVGSVFEGWSSDCSGVGACVLVMNQGRGVSATFRLSQNGLFVHGTGSGTGRVLSDPPGTDCTITAGGTSGACGTGSEFGANQVVKLTALPNEGSSFTGWSNGPCVGVNPECTVTLDVSKNVTAAFTLTPHRLTIGQNPATSGTGRITGPNGLDCTVTAHGATGSCSALFPTNLVVELTAIPTGASSFEGWGGSCLGAGASGTCGLTMLAGYHYNPDVRFAGTSPTPAPGTGNSRVTVGQTPGSTGSGTVTGTAGISCSISPDGAAGACSALYAQGATIIFEAVPVAGSRFERWGGSCLGAGTNTTCELGVNFVGWHLDPKALFANGPPTPMHAVSVAGLGSGGSGRVTSTPSGIDCLFNAGLPSGTCAANLPQGNVTLTAQPTAENQVHGWWNAPDVVSSPGALSGSTPFPSNLDGCLTARGFTGGGTLQCTFSLTSARSVGVSWLAPPSAIFFEEFPDFIASGPAWTPYFPDGGTTSYEVAAGALRVRRTGAGGAGRGALVSVALQRPVSATTELALDVKAVSASLAAGGATHYEYPANVVVTVRNADNSLTSIYYGFTISGGIPRTNTATEKHVVTPVPTNAWATNLRFVLRDAAPAAVMVERIEVGGIGWDYDAWYDNVRLQEALSLAISGTGSVALSAGGNAGDCFNPTTTSCVATYTSASQTIALAATPPTGFVFNGWSGDCSGTGQCVVTMNQARSVTATFEPEATLRYSDTFAGTLSNWTEKDPDGFGTWVIEGERIVGDYDIGCGSSTCNQTQLLLVDALQPGASNWRMEVESHLVQAYCCFNGGAIVNLAKFSLYVSDSEKEQIEIGFSWPGTVAPSSTTDLYVAHQAYPWSPVGSSAPVVAEWQPAAAQTVRLEKRGNVYTAFFNGVAVYTTTRTFSAPPKVGFTTYGKVRMDNFKLYSLP